MPAGDPLDEDFISIRDVFAFLESASIPLVVLALIGAVVAGGLGVLQRQVTAEVVLANGGGQGAPAERVDASGPISFSEWAQLRQALPPMAGAIDEARRVAGQTAERTPWLASAVWWTSNVEPVLALSRDDARMLASVGEDMKGESTRIMTFRVRHAAKSTEAALQGAETSATFMRTGSLYLELKTLLSTYQAESLTQASQRATAELLMTDVEIAFSRSRARQLEEMIRQGAPSTGNPQMIVDVGQQAQAKFLPLQTQLNAVRLEISQLEESKARLVNTQGRGRLLAEFQTRSLAALAPIPLGDGVAAADAMTTIADGLKGSIDGQTDEARLAQLETIARIRADVTALRTRYVVTLTEVSRSYQPSSLMKVVGMTAGGAIGTMLVGVVVLLLRRQYHAYRRGLAA